LLFQPDDFAIRDPGRHSNFQCFAAWKHNPRGCSSERIREADCCHDFEISARLRCAPSGGALVSTAHAGAKKFGENVGRIKASTKGTAAARATKAAPERSAASWSRSPAKSSETGLAFSVDLACVKLLAFAGIAQNLVGGIEFGEFIFGLWVGRVPVWMQDFRLFPKGFFDVVFARRFGDAKNAIGVAHACKIPKKARQTCAPKILSDFKM
jgi:hypothetical protein